MFIGAVFLAILIVFGDIAYLRLVFFVLFVVQEISISDRLR